MNKAKAVVKESKQKGKLVGYTLVFEFRGRRPALAVREIYKSKKTLNNAIERWAKFLNFEITEIV